MTRNRTGKNTVLGRRRSHRLRWRNTVAYRVARIEAIIGLDLGDPDDRLVAHIAVKIIESQGSADISG
jgi:PucR C-terminal helix-turn-helix domain